jgi:hypothetical protein
MSELLTWIGMSYLIVSLTVGSLWATVNWRRNDPARTAFRRVQAAARRRLPWTPPTIRPLSRPPAR